MRTRFIKSSIYVNMIKKRIDCSNFVWMFQIFVFYLKFNYFGLETKLFCFYQKFLTYFRFWHELLLKCFFFFDVINAKSNTSQTKIPIGHPNLHKILTKFSIYKNMYSGKKSKVRWINSLTSKFESTNTKKSLKMPKRNHLNCISSRFCGIRLGIPSTFMNE